MKTVHAFPFPFLPSRARRPVWRVLALSLALGLPAAPAFVPQAAAQSQLPALGDSVAGEFSVATERQLGDRIMAQIRRDPLYLDDPLLGDYLQSVWQALLGAARARGELSPELEDRFAWQAFLVQDRTVNAFALPGGYVGVHLGLLATTATRDEFASVLAHELSHVTQRHIARSIAQSKQQSMLAVASMIIGMIAASRSPEAANALMVGGQAAALQGQLNFSRDMEREADRIGYGVLEQAGFSPAGMASMFERLQQTSRLNDSGAYPYLRTHPLTSERIGEARARAQSRTGTAPRRELEHVVMQARARVRMDLRPDSLREWLRTPEATGADRAAQLLAAATSAQAATVLRDWHAAEAALDRAAQLARGDSRAERAVAFLRSESALARGDAQAADAALDPWRGDGSRASELLAARISLALPPASGRLKRASEDLQTWLAMHGADVQAWELLGQAWEKLGQPLRAVRAQAEARYVAGDLQGALDRLRAAQQLARAPGQTDFIEASVIEARVKQVEAEWQQRVREELRR
ncbi:M48 family metalloprotease [Caldimonas thermodepolymerans]|uniref:M48 family metalloprotease n=1 Tax=Caldimonas thermodepolymerans TaxID=215580 RepID=UPI001E443F35|nr:M48 family metalloprotease [Caldimonas thermodepolymerans]UZG44554.1 M48 family metalloprotease [Caldimonas thermodepolymerans]